MAKKDQKVKPKKDKPVQAIQVVTDPKVEAEIESIKAQLERDGEEGASKLTPNQVELIKSKYAVGASDDELKIFLYVCARTKLDPFARQIYFVKRWDSKQGRDVFTPQTSIDGLRSIAERSGNYAGNDDPIFDDEKLPKRATVSVYKIVQGQRVAFTGTARWDQYCPSAPNDFMWKKMPHLMLGKCAEALALRKAFPNVISGLYISEEMEQAGVITAQGNKASASFERLVQNAKNATNLIQLKDAREKMSKTKKYSDEQKAEYIAAADETIKRLTEAKEKENADS
jgi:phage recombination protein Bet